MRTDYFTSEEALVQGLGGPIHLLGSYGLDSGIIVSVLLTVPVSTRKGLLANTGYTWVGACY